MDTLYAKESAFQTKVKIILIALRTIVLRRTKLHRRFTVLITNSIKVIFKFLNAHIQSFDEFFQTFLLLRVFCFLKLHSSLSSSIMISGKNFLSRSILEIFCNDNSYNQCAQSYETRYRYDTYYNEEPKSQAKPVTGSVKDILFTLHIEHALRKFLEHGFIFNRCQLKGCNSFLCIIRFIDKELVNGINRSFSWF